MTALSFASLNPQQQAQVAATYCDAAWGKDPAVYQYELDPADQLTGQRSQGELLAKKSTHAKPGSPLSITISGPLVLNDKNAQVFARLLLPGLLQDQALTTAPKMDTLLVEAPSLPPAGWEQGGWYE